MRWISLNTRVFSRKITGATRNHNDFYNNNNRKRRDKPFSNLTTQFPHKNPQNPTHQFSPTHQFFWPVERSWKACIVSSAVEVPTKTQTCFCLWATGRACLKTRQVLKNRNCGSCAFCHGTRVLCTGRRRGAYSARSARLLSPTPGENVWLLRPVLGRSISSPCKTDR